MSYPDTRAGLLAFIKENVDETIAKIMLDLDKPDVGGFSPDPQVNNVWGFGVQEDNGYRVRAIFYLADEDFEIDDDWFFTQQYGIDMP